MTDFIHGVETIETQAGGAPVRGVKSSVIAIVGTAPVHHVLAEHRTMNIDVACTSDVDDAKYFGPDVSGYTIPRALAQLRGEGAKWIIVVNVFDPATHRTVVAAADRPITNGKITLPHGDILSVTVKAAGGAGATYVEGDDYLLNAVTGVLTVLEGGELDGDASGNVAYVYGNPSAVDADDVIGGVSAGGERTGMQCWLDSSTRRGYAPKVLIAPGFSSLATVTNAMRALAVASKLRAIVLADAPIGTTVAEGIEGRGPSGDINFNQSDDRLYLLMPHCVYKAALAPLSVAAAGILAFVDATEGFWVSPSNHVSKTIEGLEYPITAALNDPTCEATQLNAAGIATIFNAFGTGFRLWGNRTSVFPSDTSVKSFATQRRIADQIHEALEMAQMPHIDRPITGTLITDVLQAANDYMRTLVSRGAVPPGSNVAFEQARNPVSELQKGHLTWTITFVGSPPYEAATLLSVTDPSLLANLFA